MQIAGSRSRLPTRDANNSIFEHVIRDSAFADPQLSGFFLPSLCSQGNFYFTCRGVSGARFQLKSAGLQRGLSTQISNVLFYQQSENSKVNNKKCTFRYPIGPGRLTTKLFSHTLLSQSATDF